MKKTVISLVLTGIALTSCNSLFRDKPNNSLAENLIWDNEMLVDEYVLPWYRNMDPGFYVFVTTIMKGLGTEYLPWYGDQLTVGRRDWYQGDYGLLLKSSQQDITTRGRTRWINYYTQIASINKLLANEDLLPQRIKNRVLGEAHFFRAYYYYMLLQYYGGPLLIDHVFDPLVKPEQFPRASYEQMVQFITDEADIAASLLSKENTSDNVGRPTIGTALMLKAKTYFWVAGEHFQNAEKPWLGFPDNRTEEMLDKAYDTYQEIIDLNVYRLVDIPATTRDEVVAAYRNIFLTKNSCESIWEVQHSDDGNFDGENGHKLDRYAAPPSMTGTYCAFNPTQNHVDEYRMENGMRITDAGSGYDKKNPFEGRDWRFYANILYDGSTWKGHIMDIHYNKVGTTEVAGEDLTAYGESTSASTTRTGYYMAKFLRESQSIAYDETSGSSQNCILWRYAELLLDMAEIDIVKNREEAAREKVNKIRRRVHMPELTHVTWDDVYNERRVELAFEKTSYWDLLRWNVAEDRMTGDTNPLFGIKIVISSSGYKTITNPVVNGRNANVRYFRPRQYYWPICWDDVRYHEIEQNPEWVEM